jgi:membrane-associated phospholipid phosphatase
VTVCLLAVFAAGFFYLAHAVGTATYLISLDNRVLTDTASIRSGPLTRFFWGAAVLGDTPSMAALVVLGSFLLAIWGRLGYAMLVVSSVTVAWGLESAVKVMIHRPRPPVATALVQMPSSLSFPSGHALMSLVLFGVLGFVFVKSLRVSVLRALLLLLAAAAVLAIGLSRIYLGVHWMTDVLGSWSLGAAWLILLLGLLLGWTRLGRQIHEPRPWWTETRRIWLTVIIAAVGLAVLILVAHFDPLLA